MHFFKNNATENETHHTDDRREIKPEDNEPPTPTDSPDLEREKCIYDHKTSRKEFVTTEALDHKEQKIPGSQLPTNSPQ